MENIIAKLNRFEIRIRKALNSEMRGNFHSIFKGSGLEFSDLRTYQYGDDIRTIDWSASAKGDGTYVKIFKEEKEQTVFFMLDVSASQEVGSKNKQKVDISKEVCGVLALSAIKEASHVGLFCFSDQKELYFKPANGMKHGYEMIMDFFKLKPVSNKTDLTQAVGFTLNILKRRSVVIMISDFLGKNYQHNLKALARKHDLVVVHIYDDREIKLPKLGILPIYDKESNRLAWINTSSEKFRSEMRELFEKNSRELELLCKQHKASYVAIGSQENFVPKLIELFRVKRK